MFGNEEPIERPTRNEELSPGPSSLDRLQDFDTIIQRTPINERATSKVCQEARAGLRAMHRPKLHICHTCGHQYGNSETRIKDDGSNLYGTCPRCRMCGVPLFNTSINDHEVERGVCTPCYAAEVAGDDLP